jgi:hypothetical protein
MATDQAAPVQAQPAPDWGLPAIAAVDIRAAAFKARASRHVAQTSTDVADAVRIDVKLDAPLPIRALSPVLWVGDQRLTECEVTDAQGTSLRFWALEPQALADGAPLALGWINERPAVPTHDRRDAASTPARFVYQAPK